MEWPFYLQPKKPAPPESPDSTGAAATGADTARPSVPAGNPGIGAITVDTPALPLTATGPALETNATPAVSPPGMSPPELPPHAAHLEATSIAVPLGQAKTALAIHSPVDLPANSFWGESEIDLRQPRTAWWVWLVLGCTMALVAQGAAAWFFHSTNTFGGALMFANGALAGFISPLFQRNAKEIWSGTVSPWRANRLLLTDLLLLFMGLLVGFLVLPLYVGMSAYAHTFDGISRFIDIRRASLASLDFAGTPDIALVNVRVVVVFFLVGLIFRYVGALIAVVWNASTWGVVFAAAIAGGLSPGPARGTGSLLEGLQLGIITLPHLLLETAAYLCAAMAGVFLSRAVVRYRLDSERLAQVIRAVLTLLAVALGLVVIAALSEGLWGRWLAGQWFSNLSAME
jgi:uncharacterized membrane protein SpoIIM required for sporulation